MVGAGEQAMHDCQAGASLMLRSKELPEGTTDHHNDEANMRSKKPKSEKLTEDEAMILGSFLDFAEKGEDVFARFLLHCGIDNNDIELAGDIQSAILEQYRRPDGTYDIDAVAHDWFRWSPATFCSPRQGTQA